MLQLSQLQAVSLDPGSIEGTRIVDYDSVPKTTTLQQPITTTAQETGSPTAQEIIQMSFANYWPNQNQKYDYVMSKTPAQLEAEGIIVTSDNGSLFKDGKAWLPIQDIQKIENERGTAGALLLHMEQPSLAINTAGYQGGSTASGGGSQVTNPIPEVQQLPTSTTTPATTATQTAQNLADMGAMGGKFWWLWYLLAAVAVYLIYKYYK